MDNNINTININTHGAQRKWVKQHPYVGEDGIYAPCEEYVREGCAATYRLVISKEMFVEAYDRWIKREYDDDYK